MAGFTLVEVLVALLIMAVMAGMAWQGLDGIVRSRDISQVQLEQSLRLNTVMAQWEHDLLAVQDTTDVQALAFDGATMRLTRRAEGGMQVVAWSLRTGPGVGGVWLRWAGPVVTGRAELQDQWLRSQQFMGNEPGQLRALTGLESWQVYYFRGNAWSNAQSTGDVESPAQAGSAPARQVLPQGVRLVLAFGQGSGRAGTLSRDIALGPQLQ
jgi:general secretion pathway protein J